VTGSVGQAQQGRCYPRRGRPPVPKAWSGGAATWKAGNGRWRWHRRCLGCPV